MWGLSKIQKQLQHLWYSTALESVYSSNVVYRKFSAKSNLLVWIIWFNLLHTVIGEGCNLFRYVLFRYVTTTKT